MGDQIGGAATHQNGAAAANKEDGSKRGGAADKRPSKEAEGKPASCVIDVGSGEGEGEGERLCRVCHLADEPQSGQGELIHLGCGCKNGLGLAHRRCAEAWFTIRGCRECEICGLEAKNVSGEGDGNFIEDWNGGELYQLQHRQEGGSNNHSAPLSWLQSSSALFFFGSFM